MSDTLRAHLATFDRIRKPGAYAYERVSDHVGGVHGTHIVFGSLVHGDEVGSLPAVIRVIEALNQGTLKFGGRVTFFVGNPEAGLAGVRFLESDLNRVFVDSAADDHEGRRARQLRPILDDADVFIDLHQTIEETSNAFYIFPFGVEGWHWARAIAATPMWVTRSPEASFSAGACCADEYVRLRGKPGITIELSQRGFGNGGEERAYKAIVDTLAIADAVAAGTTTLAAAAEAKPEIAFLQTTHRELFTSDALALRPGLTNFQTVQEGELLSAPGTPELRAPATGWVLFPKYPPRIDGVYKKPLPGEIYRIIEPLPGHPLDLYNLR